MVSLGTSAYAQAINVPNGSFESPTPPPGYPATPQMDFWQKPPTPSWFDSTQFGGLTWDQLSGLFPNTQVGASDHIDNVDGQQAAYLFSVPGVGVSQELPSTYTVGYSYTLTAGILGSGGLANGSVLSLELYYVNNGIQTAIATTPVTASATAFPVANHFYDFSVTVPTVQSSDAFVGKQIGLALTAVSSTGGGYWDLDNVRLVSTTTVPEPSASLLFISGACVLGAFRFLAPRKK